MTEIYIYDIFDNEISGENSEVYDMQDSQKETLAQFSVFILEVLIAEYNKGDISGEIFAKEAALKVQFLKDYIEELEQNEEKYKIKKLLKNCHEILAENSIPQ